MLSGVCGFVGIASPKEMRVVARPEIARMLAPIAYRGPDDQAFVEEPGFAVGFRRLSIVDPAEGRQPMVSADGKLTLVCNGEIYNHRDLRRALLDKGHRFRTASDSEVVLEAYLAWGAECVDRLRGIFAFAIWDGRKRSLFLGRDRSGIKPLLFCRRGDELFFASEAKALLAHPDVTRRLDLLGLFASPEPDSESVRSPFVGIEELGAGTTLTFGSEGLRTERYWTYQPATEDHPSPNESESSELREELTRVVEMQLMSDVPLGVCLSGGLDSSFIAALASEKQRALTTFTSVVEGSHDPWFAYVLSRARDLDSRFVRFDPEAALDRLPLIAWGAEGLFDLAFASRFELASFARESGIKVLLSGQGIDELTGGYDMSYASMARAAQREAAHAALVHSGNQDVSRVLLQSLFDKPQSTTHDVVALLRRQHAELAQHLLRFEDRMGMLAGIEIRVPFLDHGIVEMCARVRPERRKLLFGDKELVREAARGVVPDSVRRRPKYAFNGNMPSMSEVLQSSSHPLRALLEEASLRDKGYFDSASVERLRRERRYGLLDAVLAVQLLDEVFVSGFDRGRFADAVVPRSEAVAVDETWMPALAIRAARSGLKSSDVPMLRRDIVLLGQVFAACGDSPLLRDLFLVRTSAGDEDLTPVPEGLDMALVLACSRAINGEHSYAALAQLAAASIDDVLAVGRFLTSHDWVSH